MNTTLFTSQISSTNLKVYTTTKYKLTIIDDGKPENLILRPPGNRFFNSFPSSSIFKDKIFSI